MPAVHFIVAAAARDYPPVHDVRQLINQTPLHAIIAIFLIYN